MQDAQVLILDMTQRLNRLPIEALQQAMNFLGFLESKFTPFYQEKSIEAKEEPKPQLSEDLLRIQQIIWDEIGPEPIPSDEPFIGDVPWNEYLKLSDEEQQKLWDDASDIDLMGMEELEVPAHVLSV